MGDTITVGEGPVYVLIPANECLLAEVVVVKRQDSFFWIDKDDHSKGKQQEYNFQFKIVEDGPYFGETVFGKTRTEFNDSDRCKLRKWVEEIFDFDRLPVGFTFDTDTLQGQPVRVIVGINEWTDKQGELQQRNQVDNLLRASAYETNYGSAPLAPDEEPF